MGYLLAYRLLDGTLLRSKVLGYENLIGNRKLYPQRRAPLNSRVAITNENDRIARFRVLVGKWPCFFDQNSI